MYDFYSRIETFDCFLCHDKGVVKNPAWQDFFDQNPDILNLICDFFNVKDWENLPAFVASCPECSFFEKKDMDMSNEEISEYF